MGMTFNMVGGGGGKAVLAVAVTNGTATSVTATKSGSSVSLTYSGGIWSAELPSFGVWTVSATDGTYSQTDTVNASVAGIYTLTLRLQDVPNAYTQLEYIRFSGGTYLNCNAFSSSSPGVYIKYLLTAAQEYGPFVVSGILDYRVRTYSGDPGEAVRIKNGTFLTIKNSVHALNIVQWIKANVDSDLKCTASFLSNEVSLIAGTGTVTACCVGTFFSDPTNSAFFLNGRLYNADFYDNGVLARKLTPARRNSDSVLGMYDTVNNVFYTNAGTGSFVAGPAV